MVSLPTLALLTLAALLAGFVDAIVGGGGLITIPALMLGLPAGTAITTILGTNKVVACTGATFATAQFVRAKVLQWRELVVPVLCSMAGASLGVGLAYLLQGRGSAWFRPVMVGLMVVMLAFTVFKPELGRLHAPKYGIAHQRALAAVISFIIGGYDGFFGPGTGSILIFLFVAVLGFDFLRSSALAKSVNWASNFASLVLFVSQGSWLPAVALAMAAGNGLGGLQARGKAQGEGSGGEGA